MKRKLFLLLLLIIATSLWLAGTHAAGAVDLDLQNPKLTEIKIDPLKFDELVGQYTFVDSPDFVLSFFREGEKFYLQATNQGRMEIFAASETKFFPKIIDAEATFVRDSAGKVTGLVWRQNGRDNQARKTSDQPAIQKNTPFEKREEMIRMRDGVRLHTLIFTPKTQTENLPFIFSRTPYGIDGDSDAVNRRYRDFIPDGYIFVMQDIRGRYGSEGEFVKIG